LLAENLSCLSESQLVLAAEYVNEVESDDGAEKMMKLTQNMAPEKISKLVKVLFAVELHMANAIA